MGVTTVIKDYGTEILNAIRENDLQKLKTIAEKQLRTDKKIQKLCIADIKHKPTKKFACPIILAARQEDPRIMKYMMDKGVDPNFIHHTIFSSKRKEIVTALHIAVDLGLYDTVQVLLDANADCNIGDHNQETPLHIGIKKADRIMTRMLLSKGADPSIPDRRGNAALHIATLYGHLQLVRSLLKYDADLYQKGQWNAIPPHIAAKEGHIHLIQLFGSRDMGNINIKIPSYPDKREKAPIHLAAENGHVETVLALLDQFDAEVNLRDSDNNTPLHCVVLNQYNPHRMRDKEYFNETAKVLLKFGVSVNHKNIYGDTPLHLAAMNQFQRIVELLLEVGANPFAENDEKLKPIDVVPDFDPVTKQVLKNAMLNPRPVGASRDTLASRSMYTITPSQSQSSIAKPYHSRDQRSISDYGHIGRSKSMGSVLSESTASMASTVFEDVQRSQQITGRGHKSSRDNSTEMENNKNHLYSKVNKVPKKSSTQQTEERRMHSTGTQHEDNEHHDDGDDDDNESYHIIQDESTQVRMNAELKKMLQKQRKQMAAYEDDSVSQLSLQEDPESTYMAMDPKLEQAEEKPRPSPRLSRPNPPQPTDKSSSVGSSGPRDVDIYENLDEAGYPYVPPRVRRAGSERSDLSQPTSASGMQAAGTQGGIRVNASKPGMIELHGYGGAPITIQFDSQGGGYTVQQAPPVQDADQYPDQDSMSFSTDITQGQYHSNYTSGTNYGLNASMESLDIDSHHSVISNDTQQPEVRNVIQQKIYEVTDPRHGGAKGYQTPPHQSMPAPSQSPRHGGSEAYQPRRTMPEPRARHDNADEFQGPPQSTATMQQIKTMHPQQPYNQNNTHEIPPQVQGQQDIGHGQPTTHFHQQYQPAPQQPPFAQYVNEHEQDPSRFPSKSQKHPSELHQPQTQQPTQPFHRYAEQHAGTSPQGGPLGYVHQPQHAPAPGRPPGEQHYQDPAPQPHQYTQVPSQPDKTKDFQQIQGQYDTTQNNWGKSRSKKPVVTPRQPQDVYQPPQSHSQVHTAHPSYEQPAVQEEYPSFQRPNEHSSPVPPMTYTRAVSYAGEEETASASPDHTPNASPEYKTFSQAMAWAKTQELKAISDSEDSQHSPYTQRRHVAKPAAVYQGPDQFRRPAQYQQHSGDVYEADPSIVATPEARHWHVQPGGAAVVESSEYPVRSSGQQQSSQNAESQDEETMDSESEEEEDDEEEEAEDEAYSSMQPASGAPEYYTISGMQVHEEQSDTSTPSGTVHTSTVHSVQYTKTQTTQRSTPTQPRKYLHETTI